MSGWMPYAFIRITLFFSAGALLGIYGTDLLGEPYSYFAFFLFCTVYLLLVFIRRRLKFNPGIVGLTTIFIAGYCNVQLQTESRDSEHVINQNLPIQYYTAIITGAAEERDRTWKTLARVAEVKTTAGWERQSGKVILYFSKDVFPQPFSVGHKLLIEGSPKEINPPANPGEFDYREFLKNRNIYHQHYLKDDKVKFIGHSSSNWILTQAVLARTWADGIIKKHVRGEREYALASALVLGVTDGLDNELLNAYAATGSMHVLSVSGLHVGIIFWIILILFKPFNGSAKSGWILAGVSLVVLWLYALVTGLSPSVLRAVTMFSFMAIARAWNLRTNIYNILAASAFCLLIYDPHMILSVGFQLSYLAVLGIVTLQPAIYRLWEPSFWFWDEVWKISAVSIAAQLATFSLGILYFHQFPNYFLISNLFVIPGSFLVLILGLIMITFNFLTPVAAMLGWCLEWIIRALNGIVFVVEKIPFSVTDNLYINGVQCFAILVMVVMIYLWIKTKKVRYAVALSLSCIVFSGAQWKHVLEDVEVKKLTIYSIPGHTAIDFQDNGKVYFIADTALRQQATKTKFHIRPNRVIGGITSVLPADSFVKQLEGCSMIVWNGIVVLRLEQENFTLPGKLAVDYVVVSNNSVKSLSALSAKVGAGKIILDSSNSFFRADRLLSEAQMYDINIFSVLHSGAFDLTI